MPTFRYYSDVLAPIKTKLDGDARFGGRDIRVFYDRTEDRQVNLDDMPCIQYFLISPWDDTSVGVGNYSIKNRKYTLRVGLCLWVWNDNVENMELTLDEVGGDLFDFLREHEYWDQSRQIVIGETINMDIDYPRTADGKMVGAQMFTVTFDQWAA